MSLHPARPPHDPVSGAIALAAEFMEFLARRGIAHAVVGNLRCFVRESEGDLDLVIDSVEGLPRLIQAFCRQSDALIVQVLQHEQTAYYFVLASDDGNGGTCFLKLDVCSDYFRGGRLLLRSREILEGRRRADALPGFTAFVPPPSTNFIYYLLKKVDKQELTAQHAAFLSRLWQEDPDGTASQIRRYWPAHDAELLRRAAASADWALVARELPRIRRRLRERRPFSLRHWIAEQVRRARRILRPTGLAVAFLGPDGAGKSTVARELACRLAPVFRQAKIHHLRAGILLRGRPSSVAPSPHAAPLHGMARSCAQLGAAWLEYTVGFVLDVLPRTICSTLVLFDRYAIDVLVDPRRYRYGGPRWLASCVTASVPRPPLVLLLDVSPDDLLGRKRELAPSECARQVEAYRQLVTSLTGGHVIDAGQPLPRVLDAASEIILNHLAERTARRHGLL